MENEKLIINPKTKVLQLIESYPELEKVIIEYLPAYGKLKDPKIRKTVAKVATLQQTATIGKIKVEDLINHLRKEVGQELITDSIDNEYNTDIPTWFNEEKLTELFDIREMLAAGEHPVNHVMAELSKLEEGMIYGIIAPFLPAPLIDKALSMEFEHWIKEESDKLYKIYFCKI